MTANKTSDLIERLKVHAEWIRAECGAKEAEDIDEAIAALSPVLADEVKNECRHLRLEHEKRAANLIERLARENANQQQRIEELTAEYEIAVREGHALGEAKEQQYRATITYKNRCLKYKQRIKELENDCKMWARQRDDEMLKATACEEQIAEYEKELANYHEKATALIRYMAEEKHDAMLAVISELHFLVERTQLELIRGMK